MKELNCNACQERMIGQGVILMNDSEIEQERWDDTAVNTFPNGIQYMVLHPLCFDAVWEHLMKTSDSKRGVVFTLGYGPVGEIIAGMTEGGG